MDRTSIIAEEISIIMPKIARRILLGFFQTVQIPQSQLFAITTIYETGPCKLSQLSQQMNISAPTVTGIVDRLEKSGYVERRHDQADRRVIYIVLTPKGKGIARKLRATIRHKWRSIISKLPAEDRENYLNILKKIQANLS